MKQNLKISTLDELKARKAILKAEQKLLTKEIISKGGSTVTNLPLLTLTRPVDPLKILKVNGEINPSAKLFSYLLPLIVNRIFFRRSGFITKMVMTMIARKVGRRFGPKVATWLADMILKYAKNLKLAKPNTFQYRIQSSRRQPKLLKSNDF
ncbi:MAG: hypothetical protein EOO20_22705 [Chryseobacterium sp.]|nr:MAG: hypothetical protein EOO20_22705 [Chryseobacterium sp.]